MARLKRMLNRFWTMLAFIRTGEAAVSFSQEGEDMILRRIFEGVTDGYYVDIGAHHPRRFSNTYHFYRLGWCGINVDAMPGSMEPFKKERRRDINIEAAVGKEGQVLTFHIFNEPALNTLDADLASQRENAIYRIIEKRSVGTVSLATLLSEYLPQGTEISFMSVDVEGHDFEVIKSNDWKRFRPKYLLVECYSETLDQMRQSDLFRFLTEKNYEIYAKSVLTVILRDAAGQP